MKKVSVFALVIVMLLSGCAATVDCYDIVATTLPVYDFTSMICEDTELTVGRLVTENVSCLHDYTLKVDQMRMLEGSDLVVISGAGLEEFLEDALHNSNTVIDASADAHLHEAEDTHEAHHDHTHNHDHDPHIWLSPHNAKIMANNICAGLSQAYPQYQDVFQKNLSVLEGKLNDLQVYGETQLAELSCRELITFHDGFTYFAESFDLTILEAIEEESGSEASAEEIIHLIETVDDHRLPAVFTEVSGSTAYAGIIASETGVAIYRLDMAMSADGYFDAMYHNIDTIKEALK